LTTQLVTAYETGDIDRFTSLFSEDAKTNDRIALQGIRQDYAKLFTTTSDRQMFIQNLKWVDAEIGAKGFGDLEVVVLSPNSNNVYSMKGKIQIVAQLLDGKTKITHLYHIEHQK
ncbi:nuclear transport factor 2 family protein, partial [Kaarinaea lacus]